MIFVNAIAAFFVLKIVFALFGTQAGIGAHLAGWSLTSAGAKWSVIWPMLPGAAFGFACLWYWLILVGRSRPLPWGGAFVYGAIIAFANVPIAGFFMGLVH